MLTPRGILSLLCVLSLLVQVKENVSKVFSRFVSEGKATIRFKEPAHELAISKVSSNKFHHLF